ncbi:MAG: hypothetical protein ABG776_04915 [Cyanobacteria bacterium J06555_13]
MTALTPSLGLAVLGGFAIAMIGAVIAYGRFKKENASSFLVADRTVGRWRGAISSAVTFIWAPAVFVVGLQAYLNGISGLFWFLAPNLLTFVIFAYVAVRVRKLSPDGFTLTEYIENKLGHKWAHAAFLTTFSLWLVIALIINSVAGGAMLSAVSGVDFRLAVGAMLLLALSYSLIAGLRASIFTDLLQWAMAAGVVLIIVPAVVWAASETDMLMSGLSGIEGSVNPFDPWVAYSVGIVATIGLIGGTLQDQMFYQRSYAVKQQDVFSSFILAGALFAIVPLALSLLGFLGAGLVKAGEIVITNPEMVGPAVIAHYLPTWALILFVVLAFAGLTSTLDSAFAAISSIVSIDIYKKYIKPDALDDDIVNWARIGMVAFAIFGGAIALLQPELFWIFRGYAAVASAGMVPVLFTLYHPTPNANGMVLAILTGLAISLPTSVYGNINENVNLIVGGTLAALAASTLICSLSSARKKI